MLILVTSLLLAAIATGAARAHAFLDHSSPLVGSTVPSAPRQLTMWYTQNLEPAFSTVQVTGPNGARADSGRARISANTMHVGLRPLGPGTYHVHWHALSVDTHTTAGSFSFTVGGR
jgi:methionine-rich copper-binding protein CopC